MRRLLLIVVALTIMAGWANGQGSFTPACSGTNDTAAFTSLINAAAGQPATVRPPWKANPAQRCKIIGPFTIPGNITIDNTDGSGVAAGSGTVTHLGPVVAPAGKTTFFGPGTWSFAGNGFIGTNGQALTSDGLGGTSYTTITGGGGGGAVDSVFGRTGVVVAVTGDYTWAQINKTASSLADLATRSADELSNGTTGTGPVVLRDSPVMVAPVLGVATATSVNSGSYKVSGIQVVGPQAATVQQVMAADAGATYTTAERDLINELKTKLNATLSALKTHGLVAVSPTDIAGLKAWYKASSIVQADNTAVASWADSSGNGWTVTQATGSAQPTFQTNELNGQPVVRFDGTDFLNIGNTFVLASSQAVTIFVVKKPVSASAQNVLLSAGLTSSGSTAILSYQQFQSTSALATHTTMLQPVSPYGHQNFARWSYNVVRTSASSTFFRVNGHQSIAPLSGPAPGFTEGMNIGAHFDGVATPAVMFNGDIVEVIIYDGVLSNASVTLVENYLALTYGVASKLIVMDGDSLTRGSGASADLSDNYPAQLAGLLSTSYDLINTGVGGQTTTDMIADAATEIDPLLTWRPRTSGLVVFWNTNDLFFSASVADTQARIQSYCTARRAVGWKCIVGTILPRSSVGTPGTYEANRLLVNQWIRDNWATFADGFFDPAADSRIGDAGDELNPAFYNDPAHLNGAGYAIVAGLVKAQVDLLIP